jgi:peptidoglycan hydrolase-like protein with peptidoglycan-binding domain
MIYLNDVGGNGLGKPKGFSKFKKFAQFAVAPQTLLLNKKQNQKLFKVVKKVSMPGTLLMRKKAKPQRRPAPRREPQVQVQEQPAVIYADPTNEANDDLGLGKPKKGFKKLIRKVNLKNTLKVVKFAGPLVAGIVPGGGTAMKVIDSKVGKAAFKVAKSKVVKKGAKLYKAKRKAKKLARGSKGEDVKALQEQLGVKPDGDFGPKTEAALQQATGQTSINAEEIQNPAKTLAIGSRGEDVKALQEQLGVKPDGVFGVKTQQALQQATGQRTVSTRAIQTEPMDEAQPQGELTPIKPFVESPTWGANPTTAAVAQVAPKNNTLLYLGGAVALAGVAFIATRKK